MKLNELVQQLGKEWAAIAKKLPGRTAQQVRDHYTKVMLPSREKPFTQGDDKKLLAKFAKTPN